MTLVLIALAWLAGIILAAVDASWWPLILALGVGAAKGLAIAGRWESAAWALLLVPFALLGLLRYEAVRPSDTPGGIALHNEGAAVRLHGTIVSHPETTGRAQRFTVRIDQLAVDNGSESTTGSVQVTTRLFPRFEYGDRLTLEGELTTPPSFDDFDYREYLARQGVVSLASFPRIERTGTGGGSWYVHLLDEIRRPLNDALERALPEPEAALARGMLLGERASIPDDLTDDFNTAGISHLVAISGANVMLVAGLSLTMLTWLVGRRWAIGASMALILLFALFVGGSASVLRATAMAEVALGAALVGRPDQGWRALIVTAAVLCALDPLIVQDVGFQLSASATAGIVLLTPKVQELLERPFARRMPAQLAALIAASMSMTIAASLFVLPVTAYAFGRVSLVALPANLFAVAAFPLILATSTATAILGVLSSDLGSVAGAVGVWPLRYLVEVGRFFASVPGAAVNLRVGSLVAIILYITLGLATIVFLRRTDSLADRDEDEPSDPHERAGGKRPRPLRIRPALLAAAVLFAASGLTLVSAALDSDDRLVVTILDVGQGDAILIQTPQAHRILIDGGPSGDRLMQALGRELPANERDLDLVVLTHGQDDHITGLVEMLARYNIGTVLAGPLPGASAAYRAWTEAVEREDAAVLEAIAGEWLDLGHGVRLEVLGPPPELLQDTSDDLNNNSVVLRLVYRDVSFLLTGDLGAEGEAAMLRGGANLRSAVLKVGHHGSDGSTTPAFLAAVQPSYAVISVGAENTYGHPSPTTHLRLQDVPVARTDVNGRVRFETDGRNLWADLERGNFRRLNLDAPVAVPVR